MIDDFGDKYDFCTHINQNAYYRLCKSCLDDMDDEMSAAEEKEKEDGNW